jgi:formate dehydrogenase iron-sulfur subunit
VADLRAEGVPAYVYGKEEIVGGLNCFFLLVDQPEVYGLPADPRLPSANVPEGLGLSALTAAVVAAGSVVAFRKERMDGMGDPPPPDTGPAGGPAAGGGAPPGVDLVAFMSAVHGANETARSRRADPEAGGGCGSGACGCHA